MSESSIEWTEHTWNPVRGCSRISPGCLNCYAERDYARKNENPKVPGCQGFAIFNERHEPHWTGRVKLIESKLDEPLRRKQPTTYFVNSVSDLFHEQLPDSAIDRVFAVMALCPQHTFQVLTKRAERMMRWVQRQSSFPLSGTGNHLLDFVHTIEKILPGHFDMERALNSWGGWPLPHVWLGVSVEDRERLPRVEHLRATAAAVRFVSFEPLLEHLGKINLRGIDLAIWGGESGPDARHCQIEWIRAGMKHAVLDGCRNFVKQLGAWVVDRNDAGFNGDTPQSWPMDTDTRDIDVGYQGAPVRVMLRDRKGGNMAEWPLDLRVRELPGKAGTA